MKRLISFVLVFLTVFFSACTDSSKEFSGINYEYDCQTYFYLFSHIVSNTDGYFFKKNKTVYFFDRESKITTPLCSKINCEHNQMSKGCNAYIMHSGNPGMWYYDNEVYIVSYNPNTYYYYIEAVSTDGSKRRKVCNLFKKDIKKDDLTADTSYGNDISFFILHRGYAYYLLHTENAVYQMFRIKLSRLAKPELICEADYISFFKGFGNKIYFSFADFDSVNADESASSFCYYDVDNNTVSVVFENAALGDVYIIEDDVYYLKGTDLFKRNLISGEKQLVYSFGKQGFFSYDGKYFYFDDIMPTDNNQTVRTILVLDKDFSVVDEIPLDKKYYFNRFGDEYYMFCEVFDGETTKTVAFDKNGIGTGRLECIVLEEKIWS